MSDREWLAQSFDYQGRLLQLRVRPAVDTPEHFEQYPHLGVLTHQLDHVQEDGQPEPAYKEALADFDAIVDETLTTSGHGTVMIIETFGGARRYYACLDDADHADAWLATLQERFGDHKLSIEVDRDKAWIFYRGYRSEYKW